MPLVRVSATTGSLKQNEQAVLMKHLSDAVLKAEMASIEDAGAQSLVWAYFHEFAQNAVYVGGENLEKNPLRIAITTPQGALNDETRKQLVADVALIVDDILGPYAGRLNHWLMFNEIDEGNWAGGGQIFPLATIQAAMNIKAA